MARIIGQMVMISIVTVAAFGFSPSSAQDAARQYAACMQSCVGKRTDAERQQKCEALCVNYKRAADKERECRADEGCRMQNGWGR